MNTYLGASTDFAAEDLDAGVIGAAAVTYLEGYLWDKPPAKAAFVEAAGVAHAAGRRVALSLSDPFCVERHRSDFLDLLNGHVDTLFANEHQILTLYEVDTFHAALQRVRGHCDVAVLTRSEKGSVAVAGDELHIIDAEPVARVVDTTGAGDAFAAGFLFGLVRDLGLAAAGRIGSIAAAEVIGHLGARPAEPLGRLIAGRIEGRL